MKHQSLEEVARQIFGPRDCTSIDRWVRYWSESRERNARLLDSFQKIALLDLKGKQILDIGCGTGGMGDLAGQESALYVGGDNHFHVLQFAHSGAHRCFLQCSGTALPFGNHSFDYVFAFDVIEHLVGGFDWQLEFLRELRRVLRPLGMIFLTTPNFWYPREGHTDLLFPQYLPTRWSDRYVAWRNPGFLTEHHSFSEIKLLTPRALRRALRKSRLRFLHDLPCGLDRSQFLRQFPFWGWLAYLGLGWYPHAEFWGILVRAEERASLRLKLPAYWHYERNQPRLGPPADFEPAIDFARGPFSHQLISGWHWYERDQTGFRWTERAACCSLQSGEAAHYLRLKGYSPGPNHLRVWVDQTCVAEQELEEKTSFDLLCLLPFRNTSRRLFKVTLACRRLLPPAERDQRKLGLMIFSVGLQP